MFFEDIHSFKKTVTDTSNKKIGFTCSTFDLLHAGHHIMLKDSKQQCDILVVALQTDPTIDVEYRKKTNDPGKKKNKSLAKYHQQYIGCPKSRDTCLRTNKIKI